MGSIALLSSCSFVVNEEKVAVCSVSAGPQCDGNVLVTCQAGIQRRTTCDIGCNAAVGACSTCGNNQVEPGETCDDGNLTAGDGCRATCQTERCGDGFVDVAEECDDGNMSNIDACSTLCKVAPDTRVNTSTGPQSNPAVAAAPDGTYLVVWEHDTGTATSPGKDIAGRRFAADGTPIGNEFTVNAANTNFQDQPAIAVAPNNVVLVVWRDSRTNPALPDIRGRRLSSDGTPLDTDDLLINTTSTRRHGAPVVTADAGGGFFVAWEIETVGGDPGDASGFAIRGRRVANDGTFSDPADLLINTTTANDQRAPALTRGPGNTFVAAWTTTESPSGDVVVRLRRFSLSGSGLAGDPDTIISSIGVDPTTNRTSLTSLSSGVLFGTWVVGAGAALDVRGRRIEFAATGGISPAADFVLNSDAGGNQSQAVVAAPGSGPFLAAWRDNNAGPKDGDNFGIRVRRYNDDGGALDAADFVINTTTTGAQTVPAAVASSGGTFFVVWQSALAGGDEIRGRFLPAGFRTPLSLP
jgi:cysteine-rich repeat protein